MHTYDAQLTVGAPQPLPDEVALDGVDEFLSTCCATTSPWPHQPAAVDFHTTEGRSWRLSLSADGARATGLPAPATAADASARGTAGELVLGLYGRIPLDSLKPDGDRGLVDLLQEPEEEAATKRPPPAADHVRRPGTPELPDAVRLAGAGGDLAPAHITGSGSLHPLPRRGLDLPIPRRGPRHPKAGRASPGRSPPMPGTIGRSAP